MGLKKWAASLVVGVLVSGCGGGGSSSSPVVASLSPSTATLSATTTGSAPATALLVSATNVPKDGLYVAVSNGAKGYVTASFDGTNVVVTGISPAALPVGTYQDELSVEVCYDDQCKRQVSNSPLAVPVTYTLAQGDPAVATPTVTGLSPSSALAGGASLTLVISGANFAPTSTVLWNGQVRATTYVSPSTLNALINASDIASITTAGVSVSNSSTGGGVSAVQSFAVTAAVPTVTSLSPATASTGGSAYTLTVNGTGFDSTAQVTWNGSVRPTSYVSASKVTAQVAAPDIAASGVFPVAVYNADGGNVSSNSMAVTVTDAPLTLASLAPQFVVVGGPAYVETVLGTGFNATSVVNWNGSARATTFVSTTQLRVQVTAADIASVGTASVTVANGGTTSSAKTLTIGLPSTDATAFQINPQHSGAIRFNTILAASALPLAPSWTAPLDGSVSYALIAGGRVFVTVERASGGSELVALSAATGAVVWGPIALSGRANATYDNGRVIVLSGLTGPGIMTGYDAATGAQLWTTALTSQNSFTAPPTAMNGMVYTGGAGVGGTLYALNDATGAVSWTARVENGDASSPTITVDGVYVSYPCQTYDLNPTTGAYIWNNSNGCEGGGGATGAYANGVYYSPNNSSGYSGMSFDAETGNFLSSYSASQPPAFGAAIGYFLQSNTLSAIGLSDSVIRWTFTGNGTLVTAPIVVNNYVFIGSSFGNLYGLDAATGAQVWQVSLGGTPNSGQWMQLGQSGLAAGDGLLAVPVGSTLQMFTLSNNP